MHEHLYTKAGIELKRPCRVAGHHPNQFVAAQVEIESKL